MSIMRLLPSPPSRIVAGRIMFDGQDLLGLSPEKMRAIRGDRIGMIFQEPMTSLNPMLSVGFQIEEVLRLHRGSPTSTPGPGRWRCWARSASAAPERRLAQYPHQLSGGLRQRVMIAMALVCRPQLLIADEPTTALDVTIQAQILDLLRRLQRELGMAILLITHDLGVVAEMCETVAVMYAGRIVERATAEALFRRPRHPYTARPAGGVAAAGAQGRQAADHRRHGAAARTARDRLQLRRPLSPRPAALPQRTSRARFRG